VFGENFFNNFLAAQSSFSQIKNQKIPSILFKALSGFFFTSHFVLLLLVANTPLVDQLEFHKGNDQSVYKIRTKQRANQRSRLCQALARQISWQRNSRVDNLDEPGEAPGK